MKDYHEILFVDSLAGVPEELLTDKQKRKLFLLLYKDNYFFVTNEFSFETRGGDPNSYDFNYFKDFKTEDFYESWEFGFIIGRVDKPTVMENHTYFEENMKFRFNLNEDNFIKALTFPFDKQMYVNNSVRAHYAFMTCGLKIGQLLNELRIEEK